ncbi:hypothetical protein BJ684DRAFT_15432 [Piptocephalis cylindrospora]|uniref:Uncharacterized protein n=1 Tax=Piptocephalis cylindrospora TaxID=1907219 RepID=A0A4P9Y8B4_9FUNG|nr:hypothetical protein BJ684DRAFT_15432 [Piptocephalis cylindrospora]|eukprot:RKP14220.1 hypothetical protein BJ684DRAFT_15432 [Piptocephalis cylindrospora]
MRLLTLASLVPFLVLYALPTQSFPASPDEKQAREELVSKDDADSVFEDQKAIWARPQDDDVCAIDHKTGFSYVCDMGNKVNKQQLHALVTLWNKENYDAEMDRVIVSDITSGENLWWQNTTRSAGEFSVQNHCNEKQGIPTFKQLMGNNEEHYQYIQYTRRAMSLARTVILKYACF